MIASTHSRAGKVWLRRTGGSKKEARQAETAAVHLRRFSRKQPWRAEGTLLGQGWSGGTPA